MRNISAAALAHIQQDYGVEPVVIVKVYWGGLNVAPTMYCDAKYAQEGLIGKLVSMSTVEDVVDITLAASSTALSVTLDDTDGSLKQIFDGKDIHKLYVEVMQWFTGIPLSEAFTLFEGQISTPIVWSEGDRTFKFDVVSLIEDLEVGYSFEEANVPNIPIQLIGEVIPVIFGTVVGLKPVPVNLTPSMIVSSGFGMVDNLQWEAELLAIQKQITAANNNSKDAWARGVAEAIIASHYKSAFADVGQGDEFGFVNDPVQADQHDQAAQNYFQQSSQYKQDALNLQSELLSKQEEFAAQQAISIDVSIPEAIIKFGKITYVNAFGFPVDDAPAPGGPLPIPTFVHFQNFPQADTYQFVGQFSNYVGTFTTTGGPLGQIVSITNIQLLTDTKIKVGTVAYNFALPKGALFDEYNRVGQQPKFVWIDGGTEVKIYNYPRIFYIGYGVTKVINVWANSKYGRRVVPPNFYTIVPAGQPNPFQIVPTTATPMALVFPIPLESYDGEWQSGSVEVDVVGGPGNAIDVMAYAIETFSTLEADAVSFAATRPTVFNCNFALTTRMNVVQFLKEIAYQSRCAIWMKNKVVYVKNLAYSSPSVATITDDDVDVDSLTVSSTPTEDIITKYVALWKYNYNEDQDNEVILRYNILKYGLIEQRYNYFAYNQYEFVEKAAQFWMIRRSNSWKIVEFVLSLNHLAIETFDTITVNFSEHCLANGPVDCLVQKAVFNSDTDSITVTAWAPVRLGDMKPYNFAFPGNIQNLYPDLTDPNIQTGNPLAGISFPLVPVAVFPAQWQIVRRENQPGSVSGGTPEDVPETPQIVTQLSGVGVTPAFQGRPPGQSYAQKNNKTDRNIKDIVDPTFDPLTSSTFFGRVLSQTTDEDTGKVTCSCDVYLNGLSKDPQTQNVTIVDILQDSVIPTSYPLVVNRTVFMVDDPDGNIDPKTNKVLKVAQAEYWAQPPVWAPALPDDSGD